MINCMLPRGMLLINPDSGTKNNLTNITSNDI